MTSSLLGRWVAWGAPVPTHMSGSHSLSRARAAGRERSRCPGPLPRPGVSPGNFSNPKGPARHIHQQVMNTAVCAAIKEQEDVAARRWRRRVSPRTAGLRRAAEGAGRNRAAAYLSSAITTASNMSCSTAMAEARLSPGPRTPAILCSSRQGAATNAQLVRRRKPLP